jgi:nanoRNase/pAp phosphatase (c-di-AMP/oligoRNAs hydrolase)
MKLCVIFIRSTSITFEATITMTKRKRILKQKRSEELLAALAGFKNIAIVTHDNPDPDAISAGWAIRRLIEKKLHIQARLVGGGDVVRAENRHMMKLVEPPIELVHRFLPKSRTAVILVDCGPEVAGHLLTSSKIEIVAVIDHHLTGEPPDVPFVDIRPAMAACATMAADYLQEQGIKPGERLATALLYAIRTETCGNEFRHTQLDRSVITWLSRFANPEWLAEIQNAPLTQAYYSDLVLALQNTFLFGDAAFCLLPRAQGQEIVGEVADLLIRSEGIKRVFCGAAIAGNFYCSVRTEADTDSAAVLVKATLNDLGNGGGHAHRAGGKVADLPNRRISAALAADLKKRWIAACGVLAEHGTRLICRDEIVDTLMD